MFRNKSKKGNKQALNDFNPDSGLDFNFDDLSLDEAESPKNDRNPALKIGKGILKGMADEATSPSFIKKLIKSSLPKEYGQAMDFADSSVNELRDIYKTALNENKPAVNQLKRNTEKVLPSVKAALPKKLADKLEKWAKSGNEQTGGMSVEDQRESELSNTLADIFKTQAQVNQDEKNRQEAKNVIRDTISQTRHNDSITQLDAIRSNVQRLSDYQDKIGSAFQRRSLELQYRHYFVARDALEQSKQLGITVKENLEAITKNTALPEVQKIKNSERFKEHIKNRFIGGAVNHLNKAKDAMFAKFKENLKKKISENIKGFAEQFENFNSMAEAVGDQMAMANDIGLDTKELYGNMAGSMLMGSLGARIGKGIRNRVKGNDKVNKMASSIAYWLGNKEEGLNKLLNSQKFQKMPGGSAIAEFIKDLMPTDRGVDIGADTDNVKSLQEPSIFNNQSRKALTEIIPGYLALLLREAQMTRTGSSSAPLVKYDYNANKFSTQSNVSSSLLDKIAGKDTVNKNKETTGRLISQMDPHNRLSKEERAALHEQFGKDRLNGVMGTSQHYSDTSAYTGRAGKFADKFAEMFKKHFELNDSLEMADTQSARDKRLSFSQGYESILTNYVDKSEEIQEMINMGQYDELRELGILKPSGEFDRNKLIEYYLGIGKSKGKPNKAKSNTAGDKAQTAIQKATQQAKSNQNNPTPNLPPVVIPILESPSINPMGNLGSDLANLRRGRLSTVEQARIDSSSQNYPIARRANPSLSQLGRRGGVPSYNTIDAEVIDISNLSREANTEAQPKQKSSFDVLVEIRDILLEFKSKGFSISGGVGGGLAGAQSALSMIGMGAGNLISRGISGVKSILPGAISNISGVAKNALKFGTSALGAAKDWLLQKKDQADLYIKGEVSPRIEAWKLQAGFYYDKVTGKVITKLSEIKNTIVDKDGNIVLDISEFKNIYLDTKSRAVQILGKIKDLGLKAIKNVHTAGASFYSFAFAKVKQALGFAREKLAGDDVYVVGRTEPALTALLMRGGNYKSKNTGKTIWKAFQIDGPVVDLEGNVLLSMDDLKLGIVDKEGKPFKGPIAKLLELGKNAVNRVKNMAVKALGVVSDIGKSVIGSVTSFITGRSRKDNINPRMFRNSDNGIIAKILMDIKKILLDRLQKKSRTNVHDLDGDGLRDNSWQERAKNAKNKLMGAFGKGKDAAAGSLAALTASMSQLTKTLKDKANSEDSGGGIWDTITDWIGGGKDKKGRRTRRGAGRVPKSKLGKAWYYTKNFGKKSLGLGKKLLSPLAKLGGKGKALLGMLTLGGLGKLFGGGASAGAGAAEGVAGAANAATGAAGATAGSVGAGAVGGAAAGASRGLAGSLAKKIPYLGTAIGALELGSTWTGNGTTKDKTLDTGGIIGGMGGGFAGGAALGAAAGAIFGGVGAIPGALIGGVLGTMAGSAAGRTMTKALYENPKLAMSALGTVFPMGPAIMGFVNLFSAKPGDGSLSKVKYAQYGFTSDESSHLSAVADLEDRLLKDVKITGGIASYDDNKLDLKKIFPAFGVSGDNEQQVKRWCRWFKTRFKPIFLTHISALAKVNPKATIKDMDSSLSATEKSTYLEMIAYPGGPYAFQESPFSLVETLKADAKYVSDLVTQARVEISKNVKVKDKNAPQAAATVGANIAAQIKGTGVDASGKPIPKPDLGMKPTTPDKGNNKAITVGGSIPLLDGSVQKLDTLSVIRMKAYGLFNMTSNQVTSISALEGQVETDVSYSSDKGAQWNGSIDSVMGRCGSLFGVSSFETEQGENFAMWFRARFLPVFLTMAGAVNKITSKTSIRDGINALRPSQKLSVGQSIIAARGKYNGNEGSIWNVTESPWKDFTLNGDKSSTDVNIKALMDASKSDIVPEKTNKIVADPTKGSNTSANQNTTKVNKEEPSFWNKTANAASNAWNTVKDYGSKAAGAVGGVMSSAGSMLKNTYNAAVGGATNAMESVGTAVKTGMSALGGLVSQLPMPTGSGTYEALKPLIHAAAAMVGVDPIVMAIMAAQESGFRPDAKAPGPNASATGLFQFVSKTWKGMLSKYGAKYGVPENTPATDPRANALMGALYTKENLTTLQKALGRTPTQTDVYLGHFLGPGTAAKFIKTDPNTIAAPLYPREATENHKIFYDGNRPRTIGEIYQWFTNIIAQRAKQFKIVPGGVDAKAPAKSGTPNTATAPTTSTPASTAQNKSAPATLPVPSKVASPVATPSTTASNIIDKAPKKSSVDKPAIAPTSGVPSIAPVSSGLLQNSSITMAESTRALSNRDKNTENVFGDTNHILNETLSVQRDALTTQKAMLEALVAIRASVNNNTGFKQPQTTPDLKVANGDNQPKQEDRNSTKMSRGFGNTPKNLVSMAKSIMP